MDVEKVNLREAEVYTKQSKRSLSDGMHVSIFERMNENYYARSYVCGKQRDQPCTLHVFPFA